MLQTLIYFLSFNIAEPINAQQMIYNPPKNLIPRVTHNTIRDNNLYFIYKVNHIDPDFIIFLSLENIIGNTRKSKIYLSNNGGISIKELHLSIEGKNISFDEVESTRGYMFLISYLNSTISFVDKKGFFHNTQKFQGRYIFLVHPNFPNLILKTNEGSSLETSDSDISTNYGNIFTQIFKKCFNFVWITNLPILISLCNNILYSIDCVSEICIIHSKTNSIDSILNVEDLIIALLKEKNGKRYIYRYNASSHVHTQMDFPNLLKIWKIETARIYKEYLYIVIKTDQLGSCLFTSRIEENKFIRLICDLDTSLISRDSCPVYISRTEGLLYANKYDYECQIYVTYISKNNGNSWTRVKLSEHIIRDKNKKHCLRLHLPCNIKYTNGIYIRRFEVLEGEYLTDTDKYRGHFFTYDWGETWKFTPFIKFKIVSINMGYALVGISKTSNLLQYTLDEGHTWYSTNIFNKSEYLISELSSDATDKNFLVVVGMNKTKEGINWIFSTIDFRNILDRNCSGSDYHDVIVHHAHSSCLRGKETFCLHKLNTSLCLHPNDDEKCHEENSCPCTIDDFECSFGYVFHDKQCIRDSFHELELEIDPCTNEGEHMLHLHGYRRIRSDQCAIKEGNYENTVNSTEYCKNRYIINFIYIISLNEFTRIDLSDNGKPFIKSNPVKYKLMDRFKFTSKFNINDSTNLIYSFVNQKIVVHQISLNWKLSFTKTIYNHSINIDEIYYDSISDSIIFNDISHKVFIVSLQTNYKKILLSDAFKLTFYENRRAISYFTNDRKFCYYHLYKSSSCIDIDDQVLNAKYDEEYHLIFLHFKNLSLIILSILDHNSNVGRTLNINYTKNLKQISNVNSYDFIGQELYYFKKSKIFNLNLNFLTKTILVHSDDFLNIQEFGIHQFSWINAHNDCRIKRCSYLCEYTSGNIAVCICPLNSTLINNTCVCENNIKCLEHLCMGFWCGNSVCIRKSSVCDGIDDCGNRADEACFNKTINRKISIHTFVRVVLICVGISGIGWLIFIFTKKYKLWRQRRLTFSFIEDDTFEFKSLLENEVEYK